MKLFNAMLYSNECGTCMSCVTHVTVNETAMLLQGMWYMYVMY